ncbi:glucose-6-phosphate isomerase [Aureococcus anophagefferens]|nr:glucose-6-phosphate isomerase [Aureococcus anophagefferens]
MSLRLLLVAVAHARLAPIRQRAASLRGGADAAWDALRAHVAADIESTHLRDLLRDDARNAALTFASATSPRLLAPARDGLPRLARRPPARRQPGHGRRGPLCAVSSDAEKPLTSAEPDNVFGFGDYVGGRFSVHSPVGAPPGPPLRAVHLPQVLEARCARPPLRAAPLEENLPVLLGLFGAYNSAVLGFPCRAVLPYAQALSRFPAHVQQLDMESNGKSVASDGSALAGDAGEIIFGEPGTNGQHSFYQLMHQGRAPDALAMGDVDEAHPERACPGNRPSLSLLLPRLDAYHVGFLVALYEHRVAVQSFLFGNNAFDQWGVQLGKVLAGRVADALGDAAEAAALNVDAASRGSCSGTA